MIVVGYSAGVGVAPFVSTVARLFELYGSDRFSVVFSKRVDGLDRVVDVARRVLSYCFNAGGVVFEYSGVPASTPLVYEKSGGQAVGSLRDLLFRAVSSSDRVVVSATPASRRLASLMSMAVAGVASSVSVRGVDGVKPPGVPRSVDIVYAHVDFCYGWWTGLYYPFTVRSCNPLILYDVGVGCKAPDSIARGLASIKPLPDSDCRLPDSSKLPPIRCRVAWIAYELNRIARCPVALCEGEGLGESGYGLRVEVSVNGRSLGVSVVDDICNPFSWVKAVKGFSKLVKNVAAELGDSGDELLQFTGLEGLGLEGGHDRLIADTNLVYRGLHLYAWGGVKPWLPQCLLWEVSRRYAEDVKPSAKPYKSLKSILAYNALEELKAAGSSILPSPPGPCDTSIPDMPITLLEGSVIATSDRGAYEYWLTHPVSRRGVAKPFLAKSTGAVGEPGYASYAILQSIIVIATSLKLLELRRVDVRMEVAVVEEGRVRGRIDWRRAALRASGES